MNHTKISGKSKFDFTGDLSYNRSMVKVALSGISQCGKTSIFNEVCKILALKYRVEFVENVAIANPFDEDKKTGFASHFFSMTAQINTENVKSLTHPDILVCDRSLLDLWIEWRMDSGSRELTDSQKHKDRLLRNIYKFWIPTYQLIFHVRADVQHLEKRLAGNEAVPFTGDSLRQTEKRFLEMIVADHLPAVEVWNHCTVDESAQQAVQALVDRRLI